MRQSPLSPLRRGEGEGRATPYRFVHAKRGPLSERERGLLAMIVVRGGRVLDVRTRSAPLADMLIDGDTIAVMGRPGLPAPADASVVDAAGKLLIPGLVNAHTHSHGNLSRGLGDRWTLELLLNAGPWLGGGRRLEDKRLSALLGAAEMIRKGCTACYDLFVEFPAPTVEGLQAVAGAYAEAGMRAVVAPMMADQTLYQAIPGLREALGGAVDGFRLSAWETSLAACRDGLRRWPFPPDRVRLALAPTIPLHCSDPFLTGCRDLAREFDVGLHMHVAESKVQALSGLAVYGATLCGHLDRLGLLGPHFTAAHGVWLDDDDMRRLGDQGASVAHNPGSNLRLGSGIAPARRMREVGVNVGIGTDAATCSDNLNMFEAMRMASFVSRVQGPDYTRWLSTDEAFAMATEGSARCLGLGGMIGTLAPGAKADIVFLDLAHVHYLPLNDALNQVVHGEDASAVDSVMIGGHLVLDHGRFTTIDVARLAAEAEARAADLARLNAEARTLAEKLEVAVGSFCRGLGARPYHVERHLRPIS
jgi:5-methylthioadenosine/S-adenosylhomocysteine deaminase